MNTIDKLLILCSVTLAFMLGYLLGQGSNKERPTTLYITHFELVPKSIPVIQIPPDVL